jgi:hypothetical protein
VRYSRVSGVEDSSLEMALGLKSADKPASTSSQGPDDSKELVSEW